jgi:hypothetical protein
VACEHGLPQRRAAYPRARIRAARTVLRAKSIILDCRLWEWTHYNTLERQFKGNRRLWARSSKAKLRLAGRVMQDGLRDMLAGASDQNGDVVDVRAMAPHETLVHPRKPSDPYKPKGSATHGGYVTSITYRWCSVGPPGFDRHRCIPQSTGSATRPRASE